MLPRASACAAAITAHVRAFFGLPGSDDDLGRHDLKRLLPVHANQVPLAVGRAGESVPEASRITSQRARSAGRCSFRALCSTCRPQYFQSETLTRSRRQNAASVSPLASCWAIRRRHAAGFLRYAPRPTSCLRCLRKRSAARGYQRIQGRPWCSHTLCQRMARSKQLQTTLRLTDATTMMGEKD